MQNHRMLWMVHWAVVFFLFFTLVHFPMLFHHHLLTRFSEFTKSRNLRRRENGFDFSMDFFPMGFHFFRHFASVSTHSMSPFPTFFALLLFLLTVLCVFLIAVFCKIRFVCFHDCLDLRNLFRAQTKFCFQRFNHFVMSLCK